MTELALQSDIYVPTLNAGGTYIDYIPCIEVNGLCCPCTNRIYLRKANFRTHILSECHIRWIQRINENRQNMYAENIKLNELVKQQQKLLVEKEQTLVQKNALIADLTGQVLARYPTTGLIDLLN